MRRAALVSLVFHAILVAGLVLAAHMGRSHSARSANAKADLPPASASIAADKLIPFAIAGEPSSAPGAPSIEPPAPSLTRPSSRPHAMEHAAPPTAKMPRPSPLFAPLSDGPRPDVADPASSLASSPVAQAPAHSPTTNGDERPAPSTGDDQPGKSSGTGNETRTGERTASGQGTSATAGEGERVLLSVELERLLVHRVSPHLSPSVLATHRGEELRVEVLVCVSPSGEVDRARTRILSAFPGTDEPVLEAVYQSRYEPQAAAFCGPATFRFKVQ